MRALHPLALHRRQLTHSAVRRVPRRRAADIPAARGTGIRRRGHRAAVLRHGRLCDGSEDHTVRVAVLLEYDHGTRSANREPMSLDRTWYFIPGTPVQSERRNPRQVVNPTRAARTGNAGWLVRRCRTNAAMQSEARADQCRATRD
jgi:hypothetical protein